jgi:hypothetical protein
VRFDPDGRLDVGADVPDSALDGAGATTSAVIVAIIEGRLDATDAVMSGLIEVHGRPDAVTALLHMIELLLDAGARLPAMRSLANDFVASALVDDAFDASGRGGRSTRDDSHVLGLLDLLPDRPNSPEM